MSVRPNFLLAGFPIWTDGRPRDALRRTARPAGQLKGVGKVWQITACDAACSYGVAWLLPAHTAEAAAHFLRTILVPHYRRAG
jgi:hypothetical protein